MDKLAAAATFDHDQPVYRRLVMLVTVVGTTLLILHVT